MIHLHDMRWCTCAICDDMRWYAVMLNDMRFPMPRAPKAAILKWKVWVLGVRNHEMALTVTNRHAKCKTHHGHLNNRQQLQNELGQILLVIEILDVLLHRLAIDNNFRTHLEVGSIELHHDKQHLSFAYLNFYRLIDYQHHCYHCYLYNSDKCCLPCIRVPSAYLDVFRDAFNHRV